VRKAKQVKNPWLAVPTGVAAVRYLAGSAERYQPCLVWVKGHAVLANRLLVVTSDLGALAETTAGFTRVIARIENRETYLAAFVEEVVRALENLSRLESSELEALLRRRIGDINQKPPGLSEPVNGTSG